MVYGVPSFEVNDKFANLIGKVLHLLLLSSIRLYLLILPLRRHAYSTSCGEKRLRSLYVITDAEEVALERDLRQRRIDDDCNISPVTKHAGATIETPESIAFIPRRPVVFVATMDND